MTVTRTASVELGTESSELWLGKQSNDDSVVCKIRDRKAAFPAPVCYACLVCRWLRSAHLQLFSMIQFDNVLHFQLKNASNRTFSLSNLPILGL